MDNEINNIMDEIVSTGVRAHSALTEENVDYVSLEDGTISSVEFHWRNGKRYKIEIVEI